MEDPRFTDLVAYLRKIPSIDKRIGCGYETETYWWIKFVIDIEHPLAWSVVQELGHVLNYVSLDNR